MGFDYAEISTIIEDSNCYNVVFLYRNIPNILSREVPSLRYVHIGYVCIPHSRLYI
jgi:hypothetical protein